MVRVPKTGTFGLHVYGKSRSNVKKEKKKSLNCFSNLLVFLCHFKCMDVFAVTSLTN